MLARLLLALALVLAFAGSAVAQLAPKPGTYDMEWAILHMSVSSDMPDLLTGTSRVELVATTPGFCPPTSAFAITGAPATPTEGGATTTWCIKSDGTFDGSSNTNGEGSLDQVTSDLFVVEAANRRGNDGIWAVGRRVTTPPPSTLKVSITAPHNSDTVSGTVWVVMWVDGSSGSSNVFTLSVDGTTVATSNAGSSHGPVTIPWNSRAALNGTHTIKATVQDATGATGSTSISVLVNN